MSLSSVFHRQFIYLTLLYRTVKKKPGAVALHKYYLLNFHKDTFHMNTKCSNKEVELLKQSNITFNCSKTNIIHITYSLGILQSINLINKKSTVVYINI